jgi:uncharacterized transporter YbjL
MRFGGTMRPAARGFLSHLAGFAAPHLVLATVLAIVATATFTAGGGSAGPFEAAILQLFISAVLLVCSAVGYTLAIAFVARQHATLRLPSVFGAIAGAVTFAAAAVGGVNQLAGATGLSVFTAVAVLGFMVGVAASVLIMLTTRTFPKQRRA